MRARSIAIAAVATVYGLAALKAGIGNNAEYLRTNYTQDWVLFGFAKPTFQAIAWPFYEGDRRPRYDHPAADAKYIADAEALASAARAECQRQIHKGLLPIRERAWVFAKDHAKPLPKGVSSVSTEAMMHEAALEAKASQWLRENPVEIDQARSVIQAARGLLAMAARQMLGSKMTPQAEPTVRAVAQTLNVEQAAEITQSDVIRQTLRRYEASAD